MGVVRVAVDDQTHDIVRVIGELAVKGLVFVICIMLGGDGEVQRAVFIFDFKLVHRVFQQGGVQRNVVNGLAVHLFRVVVEEIGDAGDALYREGAAVDLLDLVQEADEFAVAGAV